MHATTRHSHLLPAHTPAPRSHLCFGYKLTVTARTTGPAAIKRPRTRSTAVRQVSNAHERGVRTGETYNWRAAAPTLLSSCSPLPAACSAKTSYPASHPHNTTSLHATTPHSHLPLYSHPPTPTPSNTPFFCIFIDPRLCVRFFVKGARSMGPPTPCYPFSTQRRAVKSPGANALQCLNSHPPFGKLSQMALVVPSFNTPLHTRCSPPPPLTKASSSVGRALAPHRLAPPWLHH